MLCVEVKFGGICIFPAENVACVLDYGDLHTEADTEIRYVVFPCIAGSNHHAFNTAFAEAAGNKNAVHIRKDCVRIIVLKLFCRDPLNIDSCIVCNAAVFQCFGNGKIGIVQLYVFADESNGAFLGGFEGGFNHCTPMRKVGIALFKRKLFEHNAAKAAFFKHEGNIIEGAGVKVFNNAFFRNVAEQPDLCTDAAIERIITAANEDIGLNADTLQFFDGMLSGLCFQLTGCRKVRNERNMDKAALILRKLSFKLANSLKEGLGFNVADGSADFNKHDLGFDCVDGLLDAELDFVRDMRNHLHRAALVAAAAFAVENCGINLSGGGVVELCELFVNKTFVMADVKIGLCSVIGHENFAVLIGVHRSRVNIEIGVELHNRYAVAPCFQQPAQCGGGDAFAQRGNYAPGNENQLGVHVFLLNIKSSMHRRRNAENTPRRCGTQ